MTGVYQPDGVSLITAEASPLRTPSDAQVAGISTIYQEINLVPQMSAAKNLFLGHEPTTWGSSTTGR